MVVANGHALLSPLCGLSNFLSSTLHGGDLIHSCICNISTIAFFCLAHVKGNNIIVFSFNKCYNRLNVSNIEYWLLADCR